MEKFQTRSILQQEKASYKKLRGFKRKPVIKKVNVIYSLFQTSPPFSILVLHWFEQLNN